jgi:hypothetical protein
VHRNLDQSHTGSPLSESAQHRKPVSEKLPSREFVNRGSSLLSASHRVKHERLLAFATVPDAQTDTEVDDAKYYAL